MEKSFFNVPWYDEPPFGNIKLDRIVDLVEERLHLLKVFVLLRDDFTVIKGNPNYYSAVKQKLIEVKRPGNSQDNFLKTLIVSPSIWTKAKSEALHRDVVSHWILRLYYSLDQGLTKWLINFETELLRFRLMEDGVRHRIDEFIEKNNLDYEKISIPINGTKKSRNYPNSVNQHHHHQHQNMIIERSISYLKDKQYPDDDCGDNEDNDRRNLYSDRCYLLFKVNFEEALELVASRRVVPFNGSVLVTNYQMIPIICQKFKNQMTENMKLLGSSLTFLDESRRLLPMIEEAHNRVIGSINTIRKYLPLDKHQLSPSATINSLWKQSFPPCMAHIHLVLQTNHHLRHFARLQYSLFLKSLGLRLDETMNLLKQQFTYKMTDSKFISKYGYFFRYLYGRTGQRKSFSCYSCSKIINSVQPGPKDSHGCPFKEFNSDYLTQLLINSHIPEQAVDVIVKKSIDREYQGACTTYFKARHPNHHLEEIIYHPTQYFQQSRRHSSTNCSCFI